MTSTTMTTASVARGESADAAVIAVLERLYQAWAAGDADGIASRYTDDATVCLPGVFHEGPDQVRAFFTAGFAGRLKGTRGVDEVGSVRFADPDVAIVVSQGGILMPGETSVPAERLVRATYVLTRGDGNWLIASYHNCPLQGR